MFIVPNCGTSPGRARDTVPWFLGGLVLGEGGAGWMHGVPPCPRCGETDRVQKVSGILASQTSTHASTTVGYAAGSTAILGTNGRGATTLARRLAPPRPPSGLAVAFLMLLALGALAVCGWQLYAAVSPLGRVDYGEAPSLAVVLAGASLLVAGFLAHWAATTSQAVQARVPAWREAMAKWNSSWYCHRCDETYLES